MEVSNKIDKNTLIGDLGRLGLPERAAQVYVALLHLGEVGSSKIIEKTGLHGQFVYQSLHELEERGLAQHVIRNGRKKFSAKHPKTLSRLIEQQKRLADDVAERLQQAIILPQEQQLETYQGADSVVSHEFDLLDRSPIGSFLLVIGGAGDHFAATMGPRLAEYDRLRLRKKINVRYVGSEGQRETLRSGHAFRQGFEARLLPGVFGGLVNTNIWPDSVGFNIFGEPVTRTTMFSRVVAEGYAQFFEMLWKLGKPVP